MKKKNQKRIIRITSTIIAISLAVIAGLGIVYNYGNLLQTVYHCQGIERLYTGKGFLNDYSSIINRSNFTAPVPPLPPIAIYNGNPVDCDTVSVAISCLSELYEDYECAYYVYKVFDQTGEDDTGHLGVKCRRVLPDGKRGSWIVYF